MKIKVDHLISALRYAIESSRRWDEAAGIKESVLTSLFKEVLEAAKRGETIVVEK